MDKNLYSSKKNKLRKEFNLLRNKLEQDVVKENSKKIVEKIIASDFFNEAEKVMLYMPFKNEVNIRKVIEVAWENNKQVLIPKTDAVTKSMNPYSINSWDDLELGNYNIYEPTIYNKKAHNIDTIDVIFVPGLAFDKSGHRVGYGKGYYDRFFSRISKLPYIVGIAYDFQIVHSIPYDEYDWRVDVILTESQKLCT